MRSASAAFIVWLALPTKKRAYCLSITRKDATVIRGTNWTSNLEFPPSSGAVYYHTASGAMTNVVTTAAVEVGNAEIRCNFDAVTEADIKAGLYDGAAFSFFLVNPIDLTMGSLRIHDGTIGRFTLDRLSFVAELRDKFQALQQTIGDLVSPLCIYEFGSTRRLSFAHDCTKDLTSFTVTGTLDSVSADGLTLYDSARAEPGPSGGLVVVDISNTNPCVITTATNHGWAHGTTVYLSGPDGPIALNGPTQVLNPLGAMFEIDIDATNTTNYPPFASNWTATPMGGDAGYFDDGTITIGGITRRVKAYVPGQWTLHEEFPAALVGNEAYTMVGGCPKTRQACIDRDNIDNFGGFFAVPGPDAIVQIGDRSQ